MAKLFVGVLFAASWPCLVSLDAPRAIAALQTVDGKSPIQKVVALIKDMKAQTEKEMEEDKAAYDKYMCWCETTTKEKTAAVDEAQKTIANLEAFVSEAAAKEGQLKTEIGQLGDDISSDKDSLADATKLREKEAAEFTTDEADQKETLDLLGQAITVLKKATSLVQSKAPHAGHHMKEALLQVRDLVQRFPKFQGVMQKDLFDLMGSTQGFLPKIQALAQEQMGNEAKPNELEGAAAGSKSYNSRSGGIVGILQEMAEKTAKNLAAAQKSDFQAMVSFQKLKAAKVAEIAAATQQQDMKETELANLLDKVAKSKQDMETTKGALTADEQLLLEATQSCKAEEESYNGRVKVRSDEIEALGETLNILTGDEARDLIGKTISFLHVDTVGGQANLNALTTRAMQRIMVVAKQHKNWALATLAVHLRLDTFEKVIKAMDTMAVELKVQQKEEVEKKEFCVTKIDETEDSIKVAEQTKEDLAGKHQDAANTIEVLKGEIKTLKSEVQEAQVSLKAAGEDRKEANQLYQTSMSDQRATIQILNMALKRLKEFYATKDGAASLVTVKIHSSHKELADPPPKPSSAGYEKQGASGGVLQMIAKIISDAEATETELKMTEEASQQEYAKFVSATSSTIEADRASILEKEKQVAQTDSEKSYTEEAQLANEGEIEKLGSLMKATHLDCDFITKYFDVRQKARAEEIDAIAEAKAILKGADFS
jgi:hypothetical protein